jgi:hypothetical protein
MKLTMKSTKTKRRLNVKLLRRIQKHILEEPRRFIMRTFVIKGEPENEIWSDGFNNRQKLPACGTAACIAGWAAILGGAKLRRDKHGEINYWSPAKRLLGLGYSQSEALFNSTQWPPAFKERYSFAKEPTERAKIGAERIEHFIKTGE